MFRVALRRGSLISRGLLDTRYSLGCLGNNNHFGSCIHSNGGTTNLHSHHYGNTGMGPSLCRTVTSNPQLSASTVEAKDGEKRHKQQKLQWLLKAAAGALLVIGGVELMTSEEFYYRTRPAYKIEKGIRKSKCSLPYKPSIERKELNERLRSCLHKPSPDKQWWTTTIIFGPCGAGKTVAVRNVLKDQEAVIPVDIGFVPSESKKDLEKEIVDAILRKVSPSSLSSLRDDSERRWELESALKSMKRKNPRVVPTLLIEVYGNSYDRILDLLYFTLRSWVNGQNLINAVVVLSPANEAGEVLQCYDLRAQIVKINHLTTDESKDYLLGICKREELNGSDEEKEQLAKELAPIIGNRLWDLQNLEDDIRKLEGGTLENLKTLVHKRAEVLEREHESQLSWCLNRFEQSDEFKDILHKLLKNESVSTNEFYKFYKKDNEKYSYQHEMAKLSRLLSRVFDVDPESIFVTLSSPFTRKALEKHLKINNKYLQLSV